jgi:hypothetical protein
VVRVLRERVDLLHQADVLEHQERFALRCGDALRREPVDPVARLDADVVLRVD